MIRILTDDNGDTVLQAQTEFDQTIIDTITNTLVAGSDAKHYGEKGEIDGQTRLFER